MAAGNTITIIAQDNAGGSPLRSSVNVESESVEKIGPITIKGSGTMGGPDTDKEVAFACPLSLLKSITIKASGPLTLETNDGTTPDDTFTLPAGDPLHWHTGGPLANPFQEDIAALFFTNAGADDATVEIIAVRDVTP